MLLTMDILTEYILYINIIEKGFILVNEEREFKACIRSF